LNCDADKLAKQFKKLLDDGVIRPLQEGFFTKSMEVGYICQLGLSHISPLASNLAVCIAYTGNQAPKASPRQE
jgi:hypothetical protein